MIRVRHIIANRRSPLILDAEMTAAEASRFLLDNHIGGAPVTQDGQLVGFCSERDIVYRVVAAGRDPDATKVSQIMSADVLSASPAAAGGGRGGLACALARGAARTRRCGSGGVRDGCGAHRHLPGRREEMAYLR